MKRNEELIQLSPIELLRLHSNIINELEIRNIVKTRNQPIAGYSRWLISNKLNLHEVSNPNEKYDLYDDSNKKYLVRSRQIIGGKNLPFGVIRNIHDKNFDYIITIVFDDNFVINEAYLIPIDVLLNKVIYNSYQNGYIIKTNDIEKIKFDIENITNKLRD